MNRVHCLAACLFAIVAPHLYADDATSQPVVGPGEIAGVVADDSGKPIAGATVDAWSWYSGNETKTDKDGKFVLKKLGRDQPVELRVSKTGYSPWYNEAQPTGVNDLNLALGNKTYFEGTILAPDGKPVANALVRADCGPKINPGVHITNVWTETHSDKDGKYKLFVWPDNYEFQVRVPNVGVARTERKTIAQDESQPLDIHLEQGLTFRAAVVDSETGQPVENARLILQEQKGIEGKSDKAGNIELAGMMAGKLKFSVKADGYARWWSEQAIEKYEQKDLSGDFQRNFDSLSYMIDADRAEPVRIELEKAVTFTGIVKDPDGNPVSGATVDPARTGSGNSLSGDTRFSTATKKDGTFVLKVPASGAGQYNLVAHDGKYGQWRKWANGVVDPVQTKPGDQIKDVVIQLNRPATVKGKLTDASGNPVAGRRVRAQATDRLENRYYDPTTRSDKDGNFELKFIRPGEHVVQAEPFWLDAAQAPAGSSVNVTLQAGETKDEIELKAAELR